MKRLNNKITFSVFSVMAVAISYALLGRLSLMLAIPPGYATAIFPPSGVALSVLLIWGYHLWPGVFLGSLLLNVWITLAQGDLTMSTLGFSVATAVGASVQALAGAWLIHRYVGFPNALLTEREIVKYMLLAGPVACLINASIGCTSLYITGIISLSDVRYSLLTWWVGDSIGVLIFSPLMLVAFSHPRQIWWSRRTTVALPLFLAVGVMCTLFIWVSKRELERTQLHFNEMSANTHEKLRASFSRYLDSTAYVERFISSGSVVSRETFQAFVAYPLEGKPGIKGLSWNPVIQHSERKEYEKRVQQAGFPNFEIVEYDGNRQLIRASDRSTYTVVHYIEPMQDNEKAHGFDVASNAERSAAITQATDTGEVVATSRITLVQEQGHQYGFLLFHPVYDGVNDTVEARRKNIKGFAVGIFRVGDIVDAVLRSQYQKSIDLSIYEKSPEKNIYFYGAENGANHETSLISFTGELAIGKDKWVAKYLPTESYLATYRGWQAWAVFAIGLLFTSILGAFLLATTGRSYQIANLVARRTAELSGILTNALEAIITMDASGRIESINPAGEALFGYAAEEILGSSIGTVIPEFANHADKEHAFDYLDAIEGDRFDSVVERKDGSKVPIELAINSASTRNKSLYTAIIHDLTEREKLNRLKDEFISTVSHELRTPLTSINGALGLIIGGKFGDIPNKMLGMLNIAYKNSDRLESLINDLLDISKIQSIETTFDVDRVEINALIDHAIVSNQGFADKYGVRLLWQHSGSAIYVDGDKGRLLQVLSNLFSNAIKYSHKGGLIAINASCSNQQVRVSIADSGSGIPLDYQDKIFEKFTQADSSDTRRVGGTGLGLTISKAIIEQHGGKITFESRPGHGTTFYLILPLVNATNRSDNK